METEPDAARSTGPRPWLIALGAWLALVAVTSVALWQLKRDAVESQSRELGLLSLTLADGIERGLRGADEGLHALRAELREGRLALSGRDATLALNTRAGLMPLVQTLWLVDDAGRVLASSDQTPAPDLSSFHPALDRLAPGATSLSRPFDIADNEESMVAMATRFQGAPGAASGWILAGMPASSLLGAFGTAMSSVDTRASVFRADGARLAELNALNAQLYYATTVAGRLAHPQGMEVRRFADGSDNLLALHAVRGYGVQLVISRDLESVLGNWRQATEVAGVALALLLVGLVVAVHVVQRADQRRAEAQRALQAQVSRAGKLESLGTLAGGVAHDFNNILAGIVGFGEMAQDAAPVGSDQARHIGKVLQAALRGKALVERILAFSRGGAKASAVFELEAVVEEVLGLLSASLKPGVAIERVFEAQGARLRGDATQAFEACMNLCVNALQAMPRGGTLSVRLGRQRVAEPRVLSHSQLAAGDHVTLAVADQGTGITPEVMDHLFEPFFTTRAAESGTGLGLAVVFGVVTEFGGAIDVQGGPGQGARFTLYFPECLEDGPLAAEAPGAPVQAGAGQRLLVVDDEPELVALAQEMLTGLGYDPVGHTDPAAALDALGAGTHGFAAVITDEVMPGLTGTELTQALRRLEPRMPVLLVSGYGGALLAKRAADAGVTRVLSKPLRRDDLARALADLLG